jgi:hypothetical protein
MYALRHESVHSPSEFQIWAELRLNSCPRCPDAIRVREIYIYNLKDKGSPKIPNRSHQVG